MRKIKESESNIVIGPVRLSYMNVFKPRADQQGDMKFSVSCWIPKEPNQFNAKPGEDYAGLRAALILAAKAKFGDVKVKLRSLIVDGDAEIDGADPKAPGHWVFTAKCNDEYPPLLVDGLGKRVTGGWNSGDWGNVEIKLFAYDKGVNKGVSAGLRGIQFLYKDEPLGGSGSAGAGFDVVEGATHVSAASGADDAYDPFADE